MAEDIEQAPCSDPLLSCCLCKNVVRHPVLLQCLHNCCRQCLDTITDTADRISVTCPSCSRVTQTCDAEPNAFIQHLTLGYSATVVTNVCTICKESGDDHVFALEWCESCQHSLCGDCLSAHKRYKRDHCTQSLDELSNMESFRPKAPTSSCAVHNRPLEIVCFTCEKMKCMNCWATCNKSNHKVALMNDESFEAKLRDLQSALSSMEDGLVKKSDVLPKSKIFLSELKSARDNHLGKIMERKRRIMDTLERVYHDIEQSTKSMYDNVEEEAQNVAAAAARAEEELNFARHYMHSLVESNRACDLWNQQKILQGHLISLSTELESLTLTTTNLKSVITQSWLPENLDYVLKTWIGEPRICTAEAISQTKSQLICVPSGCIKLPVQCYDIDLRQDGHIFAAAREHGLLEFSSRGHKLSRWLPPKQENGNKDDVEAVKALSDGRVAVGLFYAQVVVLLKRSTTVRWIEDHRSDRLQSPALCISVHGNMLAVSQWKWVDHDQEWKWGPQLVLWQLISKEPQSVVAREYDIRGIALTEQAVVTSSSQVVLNGSREAYVVDAHGRSGDVRLWRFELPGTVEMTYGIFPDSTGRVLYVALQMCDGSSGRVATISLDDGSLLRHNLFCYEDFLLPVRLSLTDSCRTVVAALCKDSESTEQRTVTLHCVTLF